MTEGCLLTLSVHFVYSKERCTSQHPPQRVFSDNSMTLALRRVALLTREVYTASPLICWQPQSSHSVGEGRGFMRLQRLCTLVLVSVLVLTTTVFAQTTLEKVNARGKLVCGVNTGLAGFATRGADGMWRGFDVDYCRALAAAIFNDASKVEFRPLSAQQRFTALQSGEIDVLSRNTTWTLSRDASL